jgi:hypothetical protein
MANVIDVGLEELIQQRQAEVELNNIAYRSPYGIVVLPPGVTRAEIQDDVSPEYWQLYQHRIFENAEGRAYLQQRRPVNMSDQMAERLDIDIPENDNDVAVAEDRQMGIHMANYRLPPAIYHPANSPYSVENLGFAEGYLGHTPVDDENGLGNLLDYNPDVPRVGNGLKTGNGLKVRYRRTGKGMTCGGGGKSSKQVQPFTDIGIQVVGPGQNQGTTIVAPSPYKIPAVDVAFLTSGGTPMFKVNGKGDRFGSALTYPQARSRIREIAYDMSDEKINELLDEAYQRYKVANIM